MSNAASAADQLNDVVFSSERRFSVTSYYDSHGLLLLKSRPSQDHPAKTTVDVLFQDVRALELRVWFAGLTVTRRDSSFLAPFSSKPLEMIEPGLEVYELKSADWKGFVLGGNVRSEEHYGCKFYDSPLFGANRPEGISGSGPMREL